MSAHIATAQHSFGTGRRPSKSGLATVAVRLVANLVVQYRIARDTARLQNMPPHILKDIGLDRCDVDHACRYGKLPS